MKKQPAIFSINLPYALIIIAVLMGSPVLGQQKEKKEKPVVYTSIKDAMKRPEMVTHLKLKSNNLDTIPTEIYQFENLISLNLSKNKLNALPKELISISGLRYLNVSRNQIEELPSWIGQMDLLEELIINQNPIKQLPGEISGCQSLIYIDAWGTEITSFPEGIGKTPNLKTIDLQSIRMSVDQQNELLMQLPKRIKLKLSQPCNCSDTE